ncbi:hypothetical protein [Fusobacterium necrophorum]|uniref:hypothetical protein n=1 Tax=Fusobacterium necrophorum TaxID=859 RepID=UPI00370EC9C8
MKQVQKKLAIILSALICATASAEDKVVVNKYEPNENEEQIEEDCMKQIKIYSEQGYEFVSMDLAAGNKAVYVAMRFSK